MAVVLAADGLGGACAATADDGDGGARQADEDVQVREDDTEQAEDRVRARVSSLDSGLCVSFWTVLAGLSYGN